MVVVGCGSAGSRAAAAAHEAGARTLAIEGAEELGGLCILRGCMPTKTLLETTHRLAELRDAARFGIRVAEPELDFAAMMERMRTLVARFQRAKVGAIEGAGYELRRGQARFLDPHTLEVGGERARARAVVLATGSVVRPLPFDLPPGLVRDSDDMFRLEAPPRAVLVTGAGAVGLEFAQWLARLGTKVVAANRSPWLHRDDPELGAALMAALGEELLVRAPSELLAAEPCAAGVRVRLRLPEGRVEEHEVDWVLNAQGRVPKVAGLSLERVGLNAVDLAGLGPDQRAPVAHVFVAGDATGANMILHEANLEGRVAGLNAAAVARGEEPSAAYDESTPRLFALFTDPPVAMVGATPQQLESRGVPFRAARKDFPSQGRGIVTGARHGFVRLLAEANGGRVLGCQIFGARADDLIHIPAAVMRLGGTVAQMHGIPWYHPTLAEAFIEVTRALL